MSQNRNSEACLRRLMYYLDESGCLIISDQKFSRELYGSRRLVLDQFQSVSISVSNGVSTLSGGTDEQYCSILTQTLRCSPVSAELFRNNMKKKPTNIPKRPPPDASVYVPPRQLSSQPARHPQIDPPGDYAPRESLPIAPSSPSSGPSSPTFRVERRQTAGLLITRPPQRSDAAPPPPPPLHLPGFDLPAPGVEPPPGFDREPGHLGAGFEVAPLPAPAPASRVKVKFVPPPAVVDIAFAPEPILDPAWRSTPPISCRLPIEVPKGSGLIVTRRMLAAATTLSQMSTISAQYPFLMTAELKRSDDSDSTSSESGQAWAPRQRFASMRGPGADDGERPDEPPPPETRSLPAGRRYGGRPRWRRRGD